MLPFSTSDRLKWSIVGVIFIAGTIIGFQILKPQSTLPILQPVHLNPAIVADSLEQVGLDHTIGPWQLTDQTGQRRTEQEVKDRVVVANFFFTTCESICVDMTRNMKLIQYAYANDPRVQLLSHTVTPVEDSIPVLAEYAQRNDIYPDQWWLLTGPLSEINRLARTRYFAVLEEGQGWDEHSFIHTENVVLIDGLGRLRGYYDGTNEKEIQKMIKHIGWLLAEEEVRMQRGKNK